MLKKPHNLRLAAFGLGAIAALSFGSIALADDPTDSSDANAQTQMASASSDDPFSAENAAPASAPVTAAQKSFTDRSGFYASVEGSYNINNWKTLDRNPIGSIPGFTVDAQKGTESFERHGFGGRAAVGYDINKWFGVEIGGFINPSLTSKFAPASGQTTAAATDLDKVGSYGADVVGKVHMAFGDNLFGFAGAGMAWTRYSYSLKATTNNAVLTQSIQDVKWNKFSPEVLLGLGYAINQNIALTAQYTYVFGSGKDKIDTLTDEIHVGSATGTFKPFNTDNKPTDALAWNKISVGLTYKF